MKSVKITETHINDLQVSSLPSRPTAPVANGGSGFTSNQMKAAFDRLPLFLVDKINDIIDDITELEALIGEIKNK